jgi:hypothetical protein
MEDRLHAGSLNTTSWHIEIGIVARIEERLRRAGTASDDRNRSQ